MASSDDEEELVPQSVTNYYFVDENEEPISFSVLPDWFDGSEKLDAPKRQLFLHGTGDDALQRVYKQVIAWKLGLEDAQPQMIVLTKDNKWIKLLKWRKSYEGTIRTILITVQLLHYLRRKPGSSEKSLWDHLRKVFSMFDDRPSVGDLIDHYPLIKLLVERDDALAKSQLLLALLKERPTKNFFSEDLQQDLDSKNSFIITDDLEEDNGDGDGDESEEEDSLFDSVCSICDNGGNILCCDGICLRSFHANPEDGEDSDCHSLGFTRAEVDAIKSFLCKNCEYQQHQCFICRKLGSSNKTAGAEVFQCVNATCGYFYHPKCLAELLFSENKAEATEYEKKIADGESFACPVHKCDVCKQVENKEVPDLQFAVCRRCPKAYHRKCLPREIAFEDIEEEGIIERAWENLLPNNRILIYCLEHEIDDVLRTPIRNHIIFPGIPQKRKIVDVQNTKAKSVVKKKRLVSDDLPRDKVSLKPGMETKHTFSSEDSRPVYRSSRTNQVLKFQKQLKPGKVHAELELQKSDGLVPGDTKNYLKGGSSASGSRLQARVVTSSFPKVDVETEKRMATLVDEASSAITYEDVIKKHNVPSTHMHGARNIDRNITLGKVQGSVEAIKTALLKLEKGSDVEDAKAFCEPDVVKQVIRWNNKLKVYLAPFLHGMRYTSFGRHFTKVDKLTEIVDKLQWYVQDGDTIVDFCCGANDFSRLMKEKMDAVGKKCSFKNYDVIQPKYDFNFEKRDWMTVKPKELPIGSQLIMGLNPPFGVKASLANKFIDKALMFKPKLLILIVPQETERLDRKRTQYDLIWEDCEKLSGKSFYLPGSVDVNDMQMDQWNLKPPPLYLWSRSDWTMKHKAIALKQGHISYLQQEPTDNRDCLAQVPDGFRPEKHISGRHRFKEAISPRVSPRESTEKKMATENNNTSPKDHNSQPNKKAREESEDGKRTNRGKANTKGQEAAMRKEQDVTERRKEGMRKEQELAERRNEGMRKEQEAVDRRKEAMIKEQEAVERKKEAVRKEREVAERRKEDEISDMSISPPDRRDNNRDVSQSQHPFEAVQTVRESFHSSTEVARDQRPTSEFGALSGGLRTSPAIENIGDIPWRYPTGDPLHHSTSHGWAGHMTGSRDYLGPNSVERLHGYDGFDTLNRNPYIDSYGRSTADHSMLQHRPYSLLGEDGPLQRSRFPSSIPDSGLGRSDMFSASPYRPGGSVMQRYQFDLARGPGSPGMGSSLPEVRGNVDLHGGIRRDMPPDSFGFAPGPRDPFRRHGSGGWIDD